MSDEVATLEEFLAKVITILNETESNLEELARKALLKYETLDANDVKLIIEGGQLDKPTVGDLLAAEQKKSEQQETPSEDTKRQSAN